MTSHQSSRNAECLCHIEFYPFKYIFCSLPTWRPRLPLSPLWSFRFSLTLTLNASHSHAHTPMSRGVILKGGSDLWRRRPGWRLPFSWSAQRDEFERESGGRTQKVRESQSSGLTRWDQTAEEGCGGTLSGNARKFQSSFSFLQVFSMESFYLSKGKPGCLSITCQQKCTWEERERGQVTQPGGEVIVLQVEGGRGENFWAEWAWLHMGQTVKKLLMHNRCLFQYVLTCRLGLYCIFFSLYDNISLYCSSKAFYKGSDWAESNRTVVLWLRQYFGAVQNSTLRIICTW